MPSQHQRLSYLDMARAMAIVLAMLSHLFAHYELWWALPTNGYRLVRLTTRTATPTFIVLFGMMLELVYARMWSQHGAAETSRRLLRRALQCWLGFVVIAAAALVTSKIPLDQFFKSLIFLEPARFGDILKYYTFALLLAPLLVWLRLTGGTPALLGLLAAIWAYDYLLVGPLFEAIGNHRITSLLFGIGHVQGPSVIQGLTFVIVGMLLGRAVLCSGKTGLNATPNWLSLIFLLLGAMVILAVYVLQYGPGMVADNITTRRLNLAVDYRYTNDIAYYAFGLLAAGGWITIFFLVEKLRRQPFSARWSLFGLHSLFAYTAGNVLVNLLPMMERGSAFLLRPVMVLATLAALYLLTWLWRRRTLNQKNLSR